jgi:hypothetical protein
MITTANQNQSTTKKLILAALIAMSLLLGLSLVTHNTARAEDQPSFKQTTNKIVIRPADPIPYT